jgi:hypothetical protein
MAGRPRLLDSASWAYDWHILMLCNPKIVINNAASYRLTAARAEARRRVGSEKS